MPISWRPEYDSLLMMEDTSVINREQAVRFLKAAEQNPDSQLAIRTVRTLGIIGDSTAADLILPFLEKTEHPIAKEAAFALGQMGVKSARPALEKAALSGSPGLAASSVEALAKLADSASVPVVEKLFANRSSEVRYATAVSAWKFKNKRLSSGLANLLSDRDAKVRFGAAWSLARFPDSAAIPALLKRVNDKSAYVRAQVVRPLGALKVREAAPAIARLAERDLDWKVQVNACRALAAMGAVEQAPVLRKILSAEMLKKEGNYHVIIESALALGNLKDSAGLGMLRALAKRPEPFLRAAAATALASYKDSLAFYDLNKLAGDADWWVRAKTAEGLGNLQRPEAFELLTKMFSDTDFRVRYNALEAMGKYKDQNLNGYLQRGIDDSDFAMVATACGIIAGRKVSSFLSAIMDAYRKNIGATEIDYKTSWLDAAQALVDSGVVSKADWRVDSLLYWGLNDPDRLIRKKAIELGKALGKDYSSRLGVFHPSLKNDSLYEYIKMLQEYKVKITLATDRGDIIISLYGDKAPRTAANFWRLCAKGYYNGLIFHRVVPNFVIQGGCPRGDGWGGPGYTIPCEYNDLTYERGMVGMALSGKDTGGSQFFITHSSQPHLDGRYTIFGDVEDERIDGKSAFVVDNIQIGDKMKVKEIRMEPIKR